MIYIASPYTHENQHVMNNRFEKVALHTAQLMRQGLPVYSPIVHGHSIAVRHDLPTDWQFWKSHCMAMLSKADKMIVLMMGGWQDSVGVQAEIEYCTENDITVWYAPISWFGDDTDMLMTALTQAHGSP